MTEKRKCPSTAATVERAKETAACDGAAISYGDIITANAGGQGVFPVFSMLPSGEANAVPSRTIAEIMSFPDIRSFRAEIARERRAGALILSSKSSGNAGLYRPANRDELARYLSRREREAKAELYTLKATRKALRQLDGQTEIEGQG
jgi:hypothetical protein